MGKPKSNLSLHRPRERKTQLKAANSLWSNTEDQVHGCSSAQYNIKSPRTLQEPKVKTFTPSKRTVTLKSRSPKKYVHSLKRMFTKLPRTKLHDTNTIKLKTPSKSPSTKKVRKSLTEDSSDSLSSLQLVPTFPWSVKREV